MPLVDALPEPIRVNDEAIKQALVFSERSDSRLAAALFECWKQQYFKAIGYKSLEQYLMERWRGTENDWIANVKASNIYRLIQEYKVAEEVPLFKAEFDKMPRSNRHLICQIITFANAETWIHNAKTMKYKALKALINGLPDEEKPNELRRIVFSVTVAQKAVIDEALGMAGKLMELDSTEGKLGSRLEMLAAEFISTYGTPFP